MMDDDDPILGKNSAFACQQLVRTPETEAATNLALLARVARMGEVVPPLQVGLLTASVAKHLAKSFNMSTIAFVKLVRESDDVLAKAVSKDLDAILGGDGDGKEQG